MTRNQKLPRCSLNPREPFNLQVYHYLRTLIVENKLVPDTPLSENELSAHLGISRQPVREALARLSRENLINILPQKGSFVKKISVDNLREICFIRSSIECSALREAMLLPEREFNKITGKILTNLQKQRKVGPEQKQAYVRFLKLDDDFHALLCSYSRTNMAWDLVQSIKGNMDRIRFFTFANISRVDHLCAEHEAIVQALQQRQTEEACRLLHEHLFVITETYRQAMAEHAAWFETEDVQDFRRSLRRSRNKPAVAGNSAQ